MKNTKRASVLLILSFLASCGDKIQNHYATPIAETTTEEITATDSEQDEEATEEAAGGPPKIDLSLLSPKESKIDAKAFITKGKAPSPSDKKYMNVEITKNKRRTNHNHVATPGGTREIVISGKHIIIDDADLQGLKRLIHGHHDISKVVINADKVKLGSKLIIPQADIEINAQTLIVTNEGSIDITPLDYNRRGKQFKSGANGMNGNTIKLNVKNFLPDSSIKAPVFIARGGNGQDAGLGQNGAKGFSRQDLGGGVVYRETFKENCQYEPPVHSDRYMVTPGTTCHWSGAHREGSKSWPQNGGNAKAGGVPGQPGDGGKVIASFEIDYILIDVSGGKSGQAAPDYVGGNAGTPQVSHHETIHRNRFNNADRRIVATHKTKKGKDATSPRVVRHHGNYGKVETELKNTWLNDGHYEFSFKYARDLFKQNLLEEAESVLNKLSASCQEMKEDHDQLVFASQFCDKSNNLSYQISEAKDFYGNSATWVPNLSLEANYQLFDREVERSLRVIYLTRWLLSSHRDLEDQIYSIEKVQDEQLAQIEEDSKAMDSLLTKLPGLATKLADFKTDEDSFQFELNLIEEKILAEARGNIRERNRVPFYKKAIKTIAAISKVIPAGQPTLNAVATTVNSIVQGVDTEKPWQQFIQELPDSINGYLPQNIAASRENWNRTREKIDYSYYRDLFATKISNDGISKEEYDRRVQALKREKKDYLKNLGNFTKPIAEELGKIARSNQQSRIAKNELEAEIEKIKNAHPQFKVISEKLRSILNRREYLAKEISEITTVLGGLTNDINDAYLFIAKLSEAQVNLETGIDSGHKVILQDIETRAKERLDKYNYYLVKAYQYRLLKKFPGQLDLGPILQKVDELTAHSDTSSLSQSENTTLRAIYEDQMSTVVDGIIDEIVNSESYHGQAKRAFNLSKAQIAALNAGHDIYLDLKDENIFGDRNSRYLEDIRINDIKIIDMEFEVDGSPEVIAEGTLLLEYLGQSFVKKGHTHYVFEFGTAESNSRLQWGGTKNMFLDTINDIKPSQATNSLLRSIIGNEEDILLFARPGALTELRVKMKTQLDQSAKAKLMNATIEIDYDFLEK